MKRLIAAMLLLAPCIALAAETDRMAVPANYRDWVFLTSSIDLNYNSAIGPADHDMHMLDNVFVNPQAYKVFRATGTWPADTVMVKENRMAESAGTLSKSGRFQTSVMDLELHVKDASGKWVFYGSPDGKAPGKLFAQSASCYSCHQDHGAVDTTFVQFYPTLIGTARDRGTLSAAYLKNDAPK